MKSNNKKLVQHKKSVHVYSEKHRFLLNIIGMYSNIFFAICILSSDIKLGKANIFEWDYGHHHQFQENWIGICKKGKRQSPIDLKTEYANKMRLAAHPLLFSGYDKQAAAQVKNNGHTVKVTFSNGPHDDIWVKDYGISVSRYEFSQAHFHWGDNDHHGSEHTINGKAFPMEMHLVHWNREAGNTFQEAVNKSTGTSLEVLGILFKIGKTNQKLKNLFDAIKHVQKHNQTANIKQGIRLNDLLPSDRDALYRYKGSLTTPMIRNEGCYEIVMWTIFKEKIEIDEKQMNIMRRLTYDHKGNEESMFNNYRKVQLENGRDILDFDVEQSTARMSSSITLQAVIMFVSLVKMSLH